MGKCSGYHPVSKSQFRQKSGHSTFVLSTIILKDMTGSQNTTKLYMLRMIYCQGATLVRTTHYSTQTDNSTITQCSRWVAKILSDPEITCNYTYITIFLHNKNICTHTKTVAYEQAIPNTPYTKRPTIFGAKDFFAVWPDRLNLI